MEPLFNAAQALSNFALKLFASLIGGVLVLMHFIEFMVNPLQSMIYTLIAFVIASCLVGYYFDVFKKKSVYENH
jgi:hypothetical protein